MGLQNNKNNNQNHPLTPHQNNDTHPSYRPDIDGLRAVAVLSVICFHAFPNFIRSGFVGVDIFFVISGFLISTILFSSLEKNKFSFIEFYSRRIRRIFPSLLIVLVACFTFGWFVLFTSEYKQLSKHIAAGAGFISNIILWTESGYFDNEAFTKPLLHLWSLGIEEQFYIFWPFLLWLTWKRRINFLAITVTISLISFALNVATFRSDATANFYSPLTRFWELLAGSILAYVSLYNQNLLASMKAKFQACLNKFSPKDPLENCDARASNVLSIVGTLFLVLSITITKEKYFPGFWAILPVSGTVLLIAAGPHAQINRIVLSRRALVWIGIISFPLYLWHWPLLSFIHIIEGERGNRYVRIIAILLTFLLSWLTYKLVEKPFRFGQYTHIKTAILILLMIAIGITGYTTCKMNGFESRAIIKQYTGHKKDIYQAEIDDEGKKYINNQTPLFPFARYTDAGSMVTVAVIGDSHAHSAYPAIAETLKGLDINTVLLGNHGCPPFIGSEYDDITQNKNTCRNRTNQLIDIVLSKKDITHVFIFSRGTYYISARGFSTRPENEIKNPIRIPADLFKTSFQKTIDVLRDNGKKVYYVTENPEFDINPASCIPRPFHNNPKNCSISLEEFQTKQKEYMSIINSMKGATIIKATHSFCPNGTCTIFAGTPNALFADGNHLSIHGGQFQVDTFLKPHLSAIKTETKDKINP